MRKRRRRLTASLLALTLLLSSGGISALAEGETGQSAAGGQKTEGVTQDGAEQGVGLGTAESTEAAAEEQTTGETEQSDAGAANVTAISQWSWVDQEGLLQENDGVWGIGVPGASEEEPLTQDVLSSMLPAQIQAVTAGGETATLDIAWDLSAVPAEGIWSGDHVFTASLPEGYQMAEGVSGLSVTVQLGEAELHVVGQDILEANTVEGKTPQGTTINVFDYWLDEQDASDKSNPESYFDKGINSGKVLKFGKGIGTDSNTSESDLNIENVNDWTSSKAVRPGIVSSTLSDGYPVLNKDKLDGTSLAYLFDPLLEHDGKASYPNASGLLQVDDEGYFYYNSQENFAELDQATKEFTLYDTWAVYAKGGSPDGQFFPFDSGAEVFEAAGDGGIQAGNVNSVEEYDSGEDAGQQYPGVSINHYFGLTMTTRFVQRYGGYTDEDQNDKVTYEFSGDDDVWVFIDDVLVADLGGIHDAASLEIDFSSGEISVNGSKTGTLKSMYEKADRDGQITWQNNTFADNTYHTLKFFYLERGNTDSNMLLKFNLVTIPESGIIKVDQVGNHIPGAAFTLYEADKKYDKREQICSGVTDENGELVFVDDQGMPVSLEDLYSDGIRYMVLEEGTPPSGYRKSGDMELRFEKSGNGDVVLLSSNQWETGSYASAKVTAQTGAEIALSDESKVDMDTDGGTLFAVVLQRQDMSAELSEAGNWKAVSGNSETGWKVAQDSSLESIIKAAKESPYRFTVTASGAYEVNVENVPGDITKYYYMLSEGNKNKAEYTIGYFYTTATTISDATAGNTKLVDSDGFERVFSVNLYVPNIQNNLYVQKLDENGMPVSAAGGKTATFALYRAEDVDVKDDGTYTSPIAAEPAYTQTTSDMTVPLELTGGAMFSKIPLGEYYLIETDAPEGYRASEKAVHVIVDNTGVYADAGTDTDEISVRRGVGSIVRSMLQFATDDDVDATLHDIKTELVSGTLGNGTFAWGDWDKDAGNDLHLQFQNTHEALEYGTLSEEGDPYFEVEDGWSKLLVRQCLAHQSDEGIKGNKTDLKDEDLTNLFSGTVTVCVENRRINSLTLSKTVVDESGVVEKDQEFTFTITLKDTEGQPLTDVFTAEGSGAPDPATVQFTEGVATVTLTDGQSITITGLPKGAKVLITEEDIQGQTYDTTYVVGDGTAEEGKDTGELVITDIGSVNVAFTNTYVPTADFGFTKTDKGGMDEGTHLSGAVFAIYQLTCTDPSHRHEDSLIEIADAETGAITTDYEYASCWKLIEVVPSGNDGRVTFEELRIDASEYRLVELTAPDGYTLPGGQWRIAYDTDSKAFGPVDSESAVGNPPAIGTSEEGYYIMNYKPGELPFSGNTGIRLFLIDGGILMAAGAAGAAWHLRRRGRLAQEMTG